MKKICRRNARGAISIEELYNEFISSRIVRNVREATITSYNKNTKNFKLWLDSEGIQDVSEIGKHTILDYMLYLQENMNNQASINSYLRAVKALLYFAMEEEQGYIEYFRFKLPKEDSNIGSTYSEKDIKKLLKKPNFKTCYDGEYKIWVIVNYMLETGNRLSTVRNIKVINVLFEKNIIMLSHTKNRDAQFIPLTNPLSKILKKYIYDFDLKEDDFLFPTVMGKAYTSSGLAHEIAKYNKSRGVDTTATHAFRRTFASNYILSGGDSLNLKRLLGHRTLKMTEKYLKVYDTAYMSDMERFSLLSVYSNQRIIKRDGNKNDGGKKG